MLIQIGTLYIHISTFIKVLILKLSNNNNNNKNLLFSKEKRH